VVAHLGRGDVQIDLFITFVMIDTWGRTPRCCCGRGVFIVNRRPPVRPRTQAASKAAGDTGDHNLCRSCRIGLWVGVLSR